MAVIIVFRIFAIFFVLVAKSSGYYDADGNVNCIGKDCPSVSDPVTYAESSIQCNGTEYYLKDPKDCHRFYYCQCTCSTGTKNITAVHYKCPQGYGYHERWSYCVPEDMVKNCSVVYCPAYIFDGVVPDPKDCTAYYRCIYGFSTRHRCPRNSVFEPESGVCEDYDEQPLCIKKPEMSSTTQSTTTLEPVTTTEATITTTFTPAPTTSAATTTSEPITTTFAPIPATYAPVTTTQTIMSSSPTTSVTPISGAPVKRHIPPVY